MFEKERRNIRLYENMLLKLFLRNCFVKLKQNLSKSIFGGELKFDKYHELHDLRNNTFVKNLTKINEFNRFLGKNAEKTVIDENIH